MVATLAAFPVDVSASTTFNVPCGNIKLLETAVGTPGSTVDLAKGCTYQLTDIVVRDSSTGQPLDELPIVTGSVTINGHGATLLGIPNTSQTCCGRVLEVGSLGSPGYLTLNSVTITQGFSISVYGGAGGGLAVNSGSTAILNRSIVKNNGTGCSCEGGGGIGGGIDNSGTLKLNSSRVLGNSAGSGFGGGIYSKGTLSISNGSQVTGNTANFGGGIYAVGTVTIVGSSVGGNKAVDDTFGNGGEGGGIFFTSGTLHLLNARVNANSVSDLGLYGDPSEGGGIFVASGTGTSVVIDQSEIRRNTASSLGNAEGAGLYNNGATVSFVGSSVKFNAATSGGGGTADGGGVFNASGTVTQTGTTVTSNTPDDWS